MYRRLGFQATAAAVVGAVLGIALHTLGVGAVHGDAVPVAVAAAQVVRGPGVGDRVAAAFERGVLRVDVQACGQERQGSATVLLDGDRVVVMTNAHVVRGAGSVELTLPTGVEVTAEVISAVQGRDAVRLGPLTGGEPALGEQDAWQAGEGWPGGTVPLHTGPLPAVGDTVSVAGHPGASARIDSGRVVSIDRRAGFGGASDVLLVDVPVRGGSSGGAVLDSEGRVVGLVAAKDPSTGAAVAYPIGEVLGRGAGPTPTC